MLLYMYLGTTAYVWYSSIKTMIDLDKRIKKEGYTFTNKRFSIGDLVVGSLFLVALSIPVFNLAFPISFRNKDEMYMWYKDKLLDNGDILLEESESSFNENTTKSVVEINNEKLVERTNASGHIYYSPLYKGEEVDSLEQGGFTYKKTR